MSHHRSEDPDVINELDEVVLTCNIPDHGLTAGDIGTVVLVHGEGKGFEVEFMTLDGQTIAMATMRADQVRAVQHDEIPHARRLLSTGSI